ncbi:MAG: 2-oxo acid dehydrogenase subunit E2 [Proteobacteria bacterium]|nr:2-oxo acid dehydrogenase subunit E2 [Pseudomonadota bacterium]
MGLHVVKMPDIGEGIAEVELVAWHVAVGDTVKEDQGLADVMTDKASVEIPSPVAGKVVSLGGAVGEVMAVGSALIAIEVAGAGNVTGDAASAMAAKAAPAAAPAAPAPAPKAEAKAAPSPAPKPAPAPAPKAAPAPSASRPERAVHPEGRPLASPAVRQRALNEGIRLELVAPTGSAGQVTHDDLDAYLAQDAASDGGRRSSSYVRRTDETQVPVIGLRRKIAQRMQEAKRRIPHFTYVEACDVTELEALRKQLNDRYGKSRGKLTLIPFIARALVLALREFPQINARYDDEADVVTRYGAVHLGMAAQTPGGLMVPVIRHAEAMTLWEVGAEVTRLAEAARSGKATRDELQGSTITLTSLGPLGGIVTTPVINMPEVGIVGVNRIIETPVFVHGLVTARLMMNLSSSFDHRVVDGMDAAQFIQLVRAYLETPSLLFIDAA